MTTETRFEPIAGARAQYLRPLWLGILFAMAGELLVFLVFGLLLNGPGDWQTKLLWTVGFCGIGMGSAFGAFVDLLIVGRWTGLRAIMATCVISTVILGVACNVLCWRLDLGLHYFGGAEHPMLFLTSGIAGAMAGGAAVGALLFSDAGQRWLDQHGL